MDPNTRALIMGAAGAGGAEKIYVEDVFSTWLYTGNGSTQTITNGIDLAGKGGLVWLKTRARSSGDFYSRHFLYDSARGLSATSYLHTDAPDAQGATGLVGSAPTFLSNGFTPGPSNLNTETYASWTFRKAAKFFDVVTYTGNSQSNNTIIHNLGSAPGAIIIKTTSQSGDWVTLVRKNATNYAAAYLNLANSANDVPLTEASSTTVNVGRLTSIHGYNANTNGVTYVAYLFAHDAGGFGDSGNESVIKCGSYTGTGASPGPRIELGWEPQFFMVKAASTTGGWLIHDNARRLGVGPSATSGAGNALSANTTSQESGESNFANIDATGLTLTPTVSDINGNGQTYIYIAIRRGPMKAPTDATKVFDTRTLTQAYNTTTPAVASITTDLFITGIKNAPHDSWVSDRLRGAFQLITNTTGQEAGSNYYKFDVQTGVAFGVGLMNTNSVFQYFFRRAPGFFDMVAYTGTGFNQVVNHNLGVLPELTIIKRRDTTSSAGWYVWSKVIANTINGKALLNSDGQYFTGDSMWGALPTSTQLTLGNPSDVYASGGTFIAYLFASCPGVSKVGSYTGTGATLNIDCGFSNGARFVLIKRTDSTGDWYVWDTARGIVSGNDPYLLFNSAATEVTSTDFIDPLSSGFQISSTAPAAINASGGTYIYLAIA